MHCSHRCLKFASPGVTGGRKNIITIVFGENQPEMRLERDKRPISRLVLRKQMNERAHEQERISMPVGDSYLPGTCLYMSIESLFDLHLGDRPHNLFNYTFLFKKEQGRHSADLVMSGTLLMSARI